MYEVCNAGASGWLDGLDGLQALTFELRSIKPSFQNIQSIEEMSNRTLEKQLISRNTILESEEWHQCVLYM
jgi:hypothetical protein